MFIERLSLTNYRNFARLDIDVPGGLVLLVGENAQGKTSLLESIYYLSTFTSFQTNNDYQLINFTAINEPLAVARVRADFKYRNQILGSNQVTTSDHNIEMRIIKERNNSNGLTRVRKEILFDRVRNKASDAIGKFSAVLFLPQMLKIIEGSPEDRRRYLNMVMSQVVPNYAKSLTEYRLILSQRNALLKKLNTNNNRGRDLSQLSFWDDKLTAAGARLIHARISTVQHLEHLAAIIHRELTHGREILRLAYQPAFDPYEQDSLQVSLPFESLPDRTMFSLEEIKDGFLKALEKMRKEDISRGVTSIGPHRDELRFFSNRIDLSTYGSRGQARTVILSMKLAEIEWVKEKTGQWPILLLDEVLAELDPIRRSDFLQRIISVEQALLSTTDFEMFPKDFILKANIWHIQGGRIIV